MFISEALSEAFDQIWDEREGENVAGFKGRNVMRPKHNRPHDRLQSPLQRQELAARQRLLDTMHELTTHIGDIPPRLVDAIEATEAGDIERVEAALDEYSVEAHELFDNPFEVDLDGALQQWLHIARTARRGLMDIPHVPEALPIAFWLPDDMGASEQHAREQGYRIVRCRTPDGERRLVFHPDHFEWDELDTLDPGIVVQHGDDIGLRPIDRDAQELVGHVTVRVWHEDGSATTHWPRHTPETLNAIMGAVNDTPNRAPESRGELRRSQIVLPPPTGDDTVNLTPWDEPHDVEPNPDFTGPDPRDPEAGSRYRCTVDEVAEHWDTFVEDARISADDLIGDDGEARIPSFEQAVDWICR